MKVNKNSDSVELSHLGRKKGEKAGGVKHKGAAEADATSSSVGPGDTSSVEISSEAKSIASANQIAKSESVDQAKIDRIKAMMNSGTYKPDFGKVADKMINEAALETT